LSLPKSMTGKHVFIYIFSLTNLLIFPWSCKKKCVSDLKAFCSKLVPRVFFLAKWMKSSILQKFTVVVFIDTRII
jgi:hypothetical protein